MSLTITMQVTKGDAAMVVRRYLVAAVQSCDEAERHVASLRVIEGDDTYLETMAVWFAAKREKYKQKLRDLDAPPPPPLQ